MVIWIIGLSGAGKTTIGRELYQHLKKENNATVFIDGDEIRRIFQHENSSQAYTLDGRKSNADRIKELCLWLDKQNIDVVCCILSVFQESSNWNRLNYSKYFEVYIQAPMDVLEQRNPKDLYRKAKNGEIDNVVGFDIEWNPPLNPDITIDNGYKFVDPKNAVEMIADKLSLQS